MDFKKNANISMHDKSKSGQHMNLMASSQPQQGAQSVHRTISILRSVARHNDQGARLSKIARDIDLHVATVRRILSALATEGFITHDPVSKLYHLGLELFSLGNKAHQFTIRDWCRVTLERIANETGDTACLIMRSGNDSLCLDRVEGKFPIRIMSYDVGARRPLGIGAGSLALIAFLPDEQVETILSANELRYSKHNNMTARKVRGLVNLSRHLSYSLNKGHFLKGVTGVGVPIYNGQKEVVASISVSAISERMDRYRHKEIAKLIKSEIALLN